MSRSELAILFFFQFAFILAVIRVVGYLAKKAGQPQVIGEIIAGVVLGPSLFGFLLPDLQARLFPAESLSILYTVSQLGLVLYMFVIGLEFDVDLMRARKHHAMFVSLTGILAPFILGALLAMDLIEDRRFFSPTVSPYQAMLFMGAAMSVTALPVMARIIAERGLTKTPVGMLALAAGSISDVAAWCMLAIVLAGFDGNTMLAALPIAGGLVYMAVIWGILRPLLKKYLVPGVERHRAMSGSTFAFMMTLLMFAAWFTDYVGIYAVFGAFILGMAMPRGIVTEELLTKIHPLAASFLLPLFFVYSGLNTRFDLVTQSSLLGISVITLLTACLGKGLACWGAARLSGESNREAVMVGALMNARGLMELILLNIGLEQGIITSTMFTVMVLMTIITTLMVAPIFALTLRYMPVSLPVAVDSPLRTESQP
jgi:Kef-type K+ transport system membrane component KefB